MQKAASVGGFHLMAEDYHRSKNLAVDVFTAPVR
jgi:hypothetical protein